MGIIISSCAFWKLSREVNRLQQTVILLQDQLREKEYEIKKRNDKSLCNIQTHDDVEQGSANSEHEKLNCRICNARLRTIKEMRLHQAVYHPRFEHLRCPHCKLKPDNCRMEEHIRLYAVVIFTISYSVNCRHAQ